MTYVSEDLQELLDKLELPDPPEECDEEIDVAELCIAFRDHHGKFYFGYNVTKADAQEYCSRDDTHGDGWFVMWYGRG